MTAVADPASRYICTPSPNSPCLEDAYQLRTMSEIVKNVLGTHTFRVTTCQALGGNLERDNFFTKEDRMWCAEQFKISKCYHRYEDAVDNFPSWAQVKPFSFWEEDVRRDGDHVPFMFRHNYHCHTECRHMSLSTGDPLLDATLSLITIRNNIRTSTQ